MSHEPSSDRKRKAAEESEVAISSDDRSPKRSKVPTANLDSMTLSQIASVHETAPMSTGRVDTASNPSASNTSEQEASMRRIEKMIQDLSGSDTQKINSALVALLVVDPATRSYIVQAGGCDALVKLLKNCLEKAIDGIPACDQVTKVYEFTIALEEAASMKRIKEKIQDLSSIDRKRVNSALVTLLVDPATRYYIVAAGGCDALVQLLKNCLEKAIDITPECDQVTNVYRFVELQTLNRTLCVITNLVCWYDESKVGITAIGGVEALVKVMKTFPKCQALQECACLLLFNLVYDSATGKQNIIKSGGIEVLLAAVNNHLGSRLLPEKACWALFNIVQGSKKNTELLISLGGQAAIAKIRRKWPELDVESDRVLKYLSTQMTASRVSATVRKPNEKRLNDDGYWDCHVVGCVKKVKLSNNVPRHKGNNKPNYNVVWSARLKEVKGVRRHLKTHEGGKDLFPRFAQRVRADMESKEDKKKIKAAAEAQPSTKAPEGMNIDDDDDDDGDEDFKMLIAKGVLGEPTSAALFSQAPVTTGSAPVMEEHIPAPGEAQGTVLAVEISSEKRARPQTGVPTETQPSTSFKTKVVLSERQESVAQGVFPIESYHHEHGDNCNSDGKASLAPVLTIQAPEAVGSRYDCRCKGTVTVTSLEAHGEGESIAATVVTRDIRSLRERKSQITRRYKTERDSTANTAAVFNTEHDESTSNTEPAVDQIQSIGTLVQDILYSDNIRFDAALHALRVDLLEDSTKWDHFVAVAVIPIMWLVVNKAIRWLSKE
jgi:hypothetical protein